jgi:hypothetical protein
MTLANTSGMKLIQDLDDLTNVPEDYVWTLPGADQAFADVQAALDAKDAADRAASAQEAADRAKSAQEAADKVAAAAAKEAADRATAADREAEL